MPSFETTYSWSCLDLMNISRNWEDLLHLYCLQSFLQPHFKMLDFWSSFADMCCLYPWVSFGKKLIIKPLNLLIFSYTILSKTLIFDNNNIMWRAFFFSLCGCVKKDRNIYFLMSRNKIGPIGLFYWHSLMWYYQCCAEARA